MILKSLQQETNGKPVCLLIPWLLAKRQHYEKFCSIYTDRGFDVLLITPNPFDALKPMKGMQVLAGNVVKFLLINDYYDKLMIQGFSVGAYFWSECLFHLYANGKLDEVSDRFKCQIFDSPTGITGISVGVSTSLFPRNQIIHKLAKNALEFYFKTFYKSTTQYYIRGEEYLSCRMLKAPVLIVGSEIDPIATVEFANQIISGLKQQKTDVTSKFFKKSPHVHHYQMHKEEYLKLLDKHLKRCKLV